MTGPLMCRFTVPGRVVPWKRTRGAGARRYSDPAYSAYREQIAWAAKAAMLGHGRVPFGSGPVSVQVHVDLDQLDRLDLDNVVKAVLDACNEVLWDDDRQVVELSARKTNADVDDLRVLVKGGA